MKVHPGAAGVSNVGSKGVEWLLTLCGNGKTGEGEAGPTDHKPGGGAQPGRGSGASGRTWPTTSSGELAHHYPEEAVGVEIAEAAGVGTHRRIVAEYEEAAVGDRLVRHGRPQRGGDRFAG